MKYTTFTKLEKKVIKAWTDQIKSAHATLEEGMHSAISYWVIEVKDLVKMTSIPTKQIRGVISSLIKKKVFYEDMIEGDTWQSPNKPALWAAQYFWAVGADGDQVSDCDMNKIYDAIK